MSRGTPVGKIYYTSICDSYTLLFESGISVEITGQMMFKLMRDGIKEPEIIDGDISSREIDGVVSTPSTDSTGPKELTQ